jgi:hypothetical protein
MADIQATIGGDSRGFQKAADDAKSKLGLFDKSLQSTGNRFISGFIGLFSLNRMIGLVQQFFEFAESLDATASKLKLTVEQTHALQVWAKNSGREVGELTKNLEAAAEALRGLPSPPLGLTEDQVRKGAETGRLIKEVGGAVGRGAAGSFLSSGNLFGNLGAPANAIDPIQLAVLAMNRFFNGDAARKWLTKRGFSTEENVAKQQAAATKIVDDQKAADDKVKADKEADQRSERLERLRSQLLQATTGLLKPRERIADLEKQLANNQRQLRVARGGGYSSNASPSEEDLLNIQLDGARLKRELAQAKDQARIKLTDADDLRRVGNFLGSDPTRVNNDIEDMRRLLEQIRDILDRSNPRKSRNLFPKI